MTHKTHLLQAVPPAINKKPPGHLRELLFILYLTIAMTSASYETIMWENEMKKKIISHARVVFAGQVRPGTAFDVVTTVSVTIKEGQEYIGYILHVIALDELSHQGKRKVLMSSKESATEADGLDLLMRGLQGRLSTLIGKGVEDV